MNKIISIHPFKHEYASNFKSLNLEWIEEFFIVEQEDIKILSERKGMTMGELIEEMLEVYKKNQ